MTNIVVEVVTFVLRFSECFGLPWLSFRYQHGLPLLVVDWSIMSSATKKKACKNSMHQPKTNASLCNARYFSGLIRSCRDNGTIIPRFSLPSVRLYSIHLAKCLLTSGMSWWEPLKVRSWIKSGKTLLKSSILTLVIGALVCMLFIKVGLDLSKGLNRLFTAHIGLVNAIFKYFGLANNLQNQALFPGNNTAFSIFVFLA